MSTQLIKRGVQLPDGSKKSIPIVSPTIIAKLDQHRKQLIQADWNDAHDGIYPSSILFDYPWIEYLLTYPLLCWDSYFMLKRFQDDQTDHFSAGINTEGLPSYYVQNFHYQTDGYLSKRSANLYDLQVEWLFLGCCDLMRRRVLSPLKKGLEIFEGSLPQNQIRVLDVACGTGRTLKMIRGMLPNISLYGVDLSAAYLSKANTLLSKDSDSLPQLVQANAEELPYKDDYFHALTSVFLFHELPPEARQNVINECYRVTKPGGTVIICDSIQQGDSGEMNDIMEMFANICHEPFYPSYIKDDIISRLKTAGFVNVRVDTHFLSKYFIARKPL